MPAASLDLEIEQFSAFQKTSFYLDAERQPIDMTGWTGHMQIRTPTGELVYDLSTATGTISLGADGAVKLSIPTADTAKFKFVKAEYDLVVTPPSQPPYRLLAGEVTLSRGVTRP